MARGRPKRASSRKARYVPQRGGLVWGGFFEKKHTAAPKRKRKSRKRR